MVSIPVAVAYRTTMRLFMQAYILLVQRTKFEQLKAQLFKFEFDT
jgi:hypothetical protein